MSVGSFDYEGEWVAVLPISIPCVPYYPAHPSIWGLIGLHLRREGGGGRGGEPRVSISKYSNSPQATTGWFF